MSDFVHRISICMTLRRVSEAFDGDQRIELKFELPCCGEVSGGGELFLRVDRSDMTLYQVGDQYVIQMTRTS